MEIEKETNIIKPEQIKTIIENELDIDDLSSKRRTRSLAQARFIYYKLARKFCRYVSLEKIGKAVNRDHSTVVHGLNQFDYEAEYDDYMKDVYDKVYNLLDGNYIPPGRTEKFDMTFERILERINRIEQQLNKLENE